VVDERHVERDVDAVLGRLDVVAGLADDRQPRRRGADLGARAKQSREPELDEIIAIDASVRASLGTPAVVA
jgi:hypothetical protein